jgi:hypothetical protein
MQNDDVPNRCKVGKTINSPDQRAYELSGGAGTIGTWTPFFVHVTTKAALSHDEYAAHRQLADFAGSHGRAKEIFNCSPQKAKELILAGLPRFNESEAKRIRAQKALDEQAAIRKQEWLDGEPAREAQRKTEEKRERAEREELNRLYAEQQKESQLAWDKKKRDADMQEIGIVVLVFIGTCFVMAILAGIAG